MLTWSIETLPYLWIWHEHCAHDGLPDGARIHCLALEPASVSTGEGIAAAQARGEAVELAAGATWGCWTVVDVAVDDADSSP